MAMKEHDTDVILGRLSMEGYHSILKQDSGLVRVLVGPYASRAEAKETLKALQQIQKDSYIIKLR
jgi:cell division protein FtsN